MPVRKTPLDELHENQRRNLEELVAAMREDGGLLGVPDPAQAPRRRRLVSLENKVRSVLDNAEGERHAIEFFKKHAFLVLRAFEWGHNYECCVPEFRLGDEYRADFLVLSADSGSWHVALIEFESPNSRLYLKDGTPSRSLRLAQRQVSDWKNWCHANDAYIRQRFAAVLRKARAPAMCSCADMHQRGETEIMDYRTYLDFHYHIVIGRRACLSPEEQERRAKSARDWGAPEICTYDRLVDFARRDDDCRREHLEQFGENAGRRKYGWPSDVIQDPFDHPKIRRAK